MGGTFFLSWQLWQKMVFVLGVGIAIVILYGLVVLHRNRWRVRKYTALQEAQRIDLERARQSGALINLNPERLPFGVRALEAGVTTEGVIVSPSVTPNATPTASIATTPTASIRANSGVTPSSLNSTVRDDRDSLPSRARLSRLQDNNGLFTDPPSLSSSTTASISEKKVSANASPVTGSPHTTLSRSKAHRYHPRHYSDLLHSSGAPRDEATSNTIVGKGGRFKNITKFVKAPLRYHAKKTGTAGIDSGSGPSAAPVAPPSSPTSVASPRARFSFESSDSEKGPAGRKSSEFEEIDLGLLQNHRLTHAAETGQLIPRVRRSAAGATSNGVVSPVFPLSGTDGYFSIPGTMPRTSLDNVLTQSSAGPGQTTSATSATSAHSSQSAVYPVNGYALENLTSSSTPGLSHKNKESVTLTHEIKEEVRRASTVLRRVNSGFEVLVPGTLDSNESGGYGNSAAAQLETKAEDNSSEQKTQRRQQLARERSSSFVEHL